MAINPQDPQQMAAAVDRIAANQMGVDPQQPQAAAEAKAAPEDTGADQVAEQGSPKTEGDAVKDEAVTYIEIEMGTPDKSNVRKLTPEAIKGTLSRYAALNAKNAMMSPVNKVVENILRANPGMTPQTLAEKMDAMARAQQSNPTMGNVDGDVQDKPGQPDFQDLDSRLAEYEETEGVRLPPGYKDMLAGNVGSMQQLQQEVMRNRQMLQQVMAMAQGQTAAARDGMQQAQNTQVQAIRTQIANNLDAAQARHNLPDENAQEFMMFIAERGYMMEDLADPGLTDKLVADYSNTRNSPEMDRLRAIAERRQAYTGSIGQSTPTAAGTEPAPADATFDRFRDMAMSQRNLA